MYKKEFLSNGIPVITETTEGMRSVCIGIWVNVGSRHESNDKNGVSHFLEHMFFKGTRKRTARDIAVEIDSIGGELNAFTSRESTTFYVKVLDEHVPKGIELLTDVFLHSTFPEEDIEKERRIIKEEIKMVEDTPDDYIHDLFSRTVWGEEGLGQSVLGRRETIKTFTREDLVEHIRKYYGTRDTIVACAGNFEQDALIHSLEHNLGSLRRASEPERGPAPKFMSKVNIIPKDLSEVHICLGLEGLPQGSEERYSIYLLNTILGAGVSSRLFQEIREKRGLAYSIYSFISSYYDTGLWAVYAGTGRKRAREVINLIADELRGLSNTITSDELQRAKDQLKGNLILALESTSSRMTNIARQEIYYGRYFSPDEIMKAVDAVTLEEIKGLADRLINQRSDRDREETPQTQPTQLTPQTPQTPSAGSGQVSYDSQRVPFALVVYGPVKEKVYDL
ncbi:MAG: insulinase family protein [Nitrospirae bacterium]|nr:insulinase family protein [Nitrospirota bacterium]